MPFGLIWAPFDRLRAGPSINSGLVWHAVFKENFRHSTPDQKFSNKALGHDFCKNRNLNKPEGM